jgi:ADP-ribose pyrophosphatase
MKITESEELLRTPIFWVTMDKAIDPEGFEIRRAIIQHIGSAVVMPVDEKGRVLLARQFASPPATISGRSPPAASMKAKPRSRPPSAS